MMMAVTAWSRRTEAPKASATGGDRSQPWWRWRWFSLLHNLD
jgi:hypothetical protein